MDHFKNKAFIFLEILQVNHVQYVQFFYMGDLFKYTMKLTPTNKTILTTTVLYDRDK